MWLSNFPPFSSRFLHIVVDIYYVMSLFSFITSNILLHFPHVTLPLDKERVFKKLEQHLK